MRTTGKGLYKWVNAQENVRWPSIYNGLLVYFTYKGVEVCGMVKKTHDGKGRLVRTDLEIKPKQSIHDIGNGAGMSVFMIFEKDATKPPKINQ